MPMKNEEFSRLSFAARLCESSVGVLQHVAIATAPRTRDGDGAGLRIRYSICLLSEAWCLW
jgi:hypothetical protein